MVYTLIVLIKVLLVGNHDDMLDLFPGINVKFMYIVYIANVT